MPVSQGCLCEGEVVRYLVLSLCVFKDGVKIFFLLSEIEIKYLTVSS